MRIRKVGRPAPVAKSGHGGFFVRAPGLRRMAAGGRDSSARFLAGRHRGFGNCSWHPRRNQLYRDAVATIRSAGATC